MKYIGCENHSSQKDSRAKHTGLKVGSGVSVRISCAFKAKSISIDKQGSGDKRAMASAGDGSHESYVHGPQSGPSYLLMCHLFHASSL